MERKGCYDLRVEPHQVDFSLRATLSAVCDYILHAAGLDADNNGFGVRDLNMEGTSWVLSRMSVEVFRRMDQYEEFTVRTWVNDVNRMMTTRNMVITDARGEMVAAAVTQWAVIDVRKRRAIDITKHLDFTRAVTDEPCPIEKPVRVPAFEPQQTEIHKVVYSDIDFNRHVGSMRYVTLMYDMLPDDTIMNKELRRLDINYIHESRFGQTLQIGFCDDAQSLFEIDTDDGQSVCRAAMTWA